MKRIAFLALTLTCAGCAKEKDTTPSPAAHVQRGKEKTAHQNELGQIALFYITYHAQEGRAPANFAELKAFMGNEGNRLAQLIEQGDLVVVYNAKPTSNTVLAYEKKVDLNGNQLAAMGDKSVKPMKAEELQKALVVKE